MTRILRGLHSRYPVEQQQVAAGGQAALYNIPGTPMLYKRFMSAPPNPAAADDLRRRLREMSTLGHRVFTLDHTEPGSTAAASFAWPVDVVENAGGLPEGVIIPRASHRFYRDLGAKKLRTLEFLYLYRTDPPDALDRTRILIRVCEALAALSQMRLVHGDVAPKNILWSTQPVPAIFVIDMDGVHKDGSPYWSHVHTPEWSDPRVLSGASTGHDMSSDWYALALLIARVLLCSRFLFDYTDEAAIDQGVARLPSPISNHLLMSLTAHDTTKHRVSPETWEEVLEKTILPSGRPDTARLARIDLAAAQRRRDERRAGALGPPFSELASILAGLAS